MSTGVVVLTVICLLLFAIAAVRKPHGIVPALRSAREQIIVFGIRLPLALASAAFLSTVVPTSSVGAWIGAESGWQGVMIATVFGAIVPGGPIFTFPLALLIWRSGAGDAQMIAFLASWSIFAMHRVISYELPMLGGRFVLLRMASSWMLPPIAGFVAMALIALSLW